MIIVLRMLAYLWALPTTVVGMLFIGSALVSGGELKLVQGVLEIHGGFVSWFLEHLVPLPGGATAMTLGHVVLGRDWASVEMSRRHERVHVRQCELWGPIFLPAYGLASLWCWIRGKDPYRSNPFEVQAYRKA